ncbi:acyltransferase [Phytoactinopolyspora endophytica]|uniref:acyltransferase n=1 Tax=Phytoactinopolyspora endophytica TaxID=1642495 RepID=UPI00197C7907|nr:acyltransferase [Phytoactinopolyspora endophytica]
MTIEPGAYIEHPEMFSAGDHVRIGRGFYSQGMPRVQIDSRVTFYPWCFVQGEGEIFIDEGVTLYPNTYMSTGHASGQIWIGKRSHLAMGCALYGGRGLTVGEYCNIAAHVVLSTVQHDTRVHHQPMALAPKDGGQITIGDDVWIGANATVTPGVTLARGSIVAAGAVVTRDTETYGIYAGVPARLLRFRQPAT